jgi:hypothetical protein
MPSVQRDPCGGAQRNRLIVVDAMDDPAHEFHRHHDFIPVAGAARLYMKISTARAALGGSAEA